MHHNDSRNIVQFENALKVQLAIRNMVDICTDVQLAQHLSELDYYTFAFNLA